MSAQRRERVHARWGWRSTPGPRPAGAGDGREAPQKNFGVLNFGNFHLIFPFKTAETAETVFSACRLNQPKQPKRFFQHAGLISLISLIGLISNMRGHALRDVVMATCGDVSAVSCEETANAASH